MFRFSNFGVSLADTLRAPGSAGHRLWWLWCAFTCSALLAASIGLAACVRLPAGERLVHSERSSWQTIIVSDSATRRCLRFDDGTAALNQSCQLLAEPQHLAFDYTRAMVAVLLLWEPPPHKVLLIGVGGGSIATALTVARPGIDIDAVDIDPAVLEVAQRYFGLVAGPQLRLHAADGRDFVAAARTKGVKYDAVLLDAFDAGGIPPALFSEEFLRDARALLAPGGVFSPTRSPVALRTSRRRATPTGCSARSTALG